MVENKLRIIIVDDMDSVRETIASYFSMRGYEVFTAASGEKALPIIIEKKPDLMLLDLNLGGMTGLELLKLVREFNDIAKVIMITGFDIGFADNPDFQKLGVSDVLQKPITVSKLKEIITKVLGK